MPKFDFASERLLSGEVADRFTIRRAQYGVAVSAVLFRRRFILDLVTKY